MNFKKSVPIFFSILCLLLASSLKASDNDSSKCSSIDNVANTSDVDIANGPFKYTSITATSYTFNGTGGTTTFSFTVTAPNAQDGDNDPVVFAGQGASSGSCTTSANATIGITGITQVLDANGNLSGVSLDPTTGLGLQIASAFNFNPASHTFTPGSFVIVTVTLNNPNLNPANYGEYDIQIGAFAPGNGIGVGAFDFDLTLQQGGSSCSITFTTLGPTNNSVASNVVLGPVDFAVSVADTGSVLTSLTASISSAGGAVSGVNIPLTINPGLPAASTTATGSYTPADGATTLVSAFTSSAPSGIGTYTITVNGADQAGATCSKSATFHVNYNLTFTKSFVPNGCSSGNTHPCMAMMAATAVRSDGTFMFDKTVKFELLDSSSTAVATHDYGTGAITSYVQINSISSPPYWDYETTFAGSSLTYGTYTVQALFMDVDGNWDLQGTQSVTF